MHKNSKHDAFQIFYFCNLLLKNKEISRKEASRLCRMQVTSSYRFIDRFNEVTKVALKMIGFKRDQFDNILQNPDLFHSQLKKFALESNDKEKTHSN